MRANLSVGRRLTFLAMLFTGMVGAQSAGKDLLSQAAARNNEAISLARAGREAEAEQLYRAALGAGYEDDLARAKIANNLAALYQREDRFREAEVMYRCALQWRQKHLAAESVEVAYSLNNLADVYRAEGRDWEARNLMETALRTLQQFNADAPGLPSVLNNLAILRCRFGEVDQAEDLLRTALRSYDWNPDTASREYGVTLNNLGKVLETKNDFLAARPLYEQAIGIFERLGAPARKDLASALANTGVLYQRLDRTEDARQAEQRALELLRPTGDAVLRAQVLRNLGNIVARTGSPVDALPYFEQSLSIQDKTLGQDHPATARLLLDYASATLRAGNKSLSRKLRKRAAELVARFNLQSLDHMTVSVRALRDDK
ncbi:MAG: tetratricopeptide repeat protein [Bryobacteraceae bacterium]